MDSEAAAHALSGALGGIASMALLYPLTNVQLRLSTQVYRTHPSSPVPAASNATSSTPHHAVVAVSSGVKPAGHSHSVATSASQPRSAGRPHPEEAISNETKPSTADSVLPDAFVPRYRGFWDCVVKLAREEGWTSLYAGIYMMLELFKALPCHIQST